MLEQAALADAWLATDQEDRSRSAVGGRREQSVDSGALGETADERDDRASRGVPRRLLIDRRGVEPCSRFGRSRPDLAPGTLERTGQRRSDFALEQAPGVLILRKSFTSTTESGEKPNDAGMAVFR